MIEDNDTTTTVGTTITTGASATPTATDMFALPPPPHY